MGSKGSHKTITLATAVKDLRDSLGLSKKQFAKLTGISYPYVCRMESRPINPRLNTLMRLRTAGLGAFICTEACSDPKHLTLISGIEPATLSREAGRGRRTK